MSAAAVGLDSFLEPLSRCLDAESAQRVFAFRVAPTVQKRIDGLAKRANRGILTPSERDEYETLINAADFISILKLKAKRRLEEQVAPR